MNSENNLIKDSDGVNGSYGVNLSNGVNRSNGVNGSNGVNWSYGVNLSYGVNWSYGVLGSRGVSHSVFVLNRKMKPKIFKTFVTEERVAEVINEIERLSNGWRPTFNNLKALYLANGSDWKKVPVADAKELQKIEAWADMPKAAEDYIRSLPEFDAKIFEEITGKK